MMGVKGRLLKKLKTIKTIGYLKPERILQVNATDGYFYTSPQKSVPRPPLATIQEEPKNRINDDVFEEPEVIDVTELMKDLEDQETEIDTNDADKENVTPIDKSGFRRPDLNSRTLFDPNLLAAFEQAVGEVLKLREAARRLMFEESNLLEELSEPPLKTRKIEQIADPIEEFEQRCPPGGSDSVVLYTTGLRGIRRTFEDCQKIRSLLQNLRVVFFERDISMHSEFKEEMWRILEGKMVPPRLFIKGRYIGGAEEVLGLHEEGRLKPLMEGIPIDKNEGPCEGCVGMRFIVCFNCNGSRKIAVEGGGGPIDCSECNENGVIICPFCC
ncbi:hypothetical protein ACS0TY_000771 [Phlomoides rotata]